MRFLRTAAKELQVALRRVRTRSPGATALRGETAKASGGSEIVARLEADCLAARAASRATLFAEFLILFADEVGVVLQQTAMSAKADVPCIHCGEPWECDAYEAAKRPFVCPDCETPEIEYEHPRQPDDR